MGTYVTGTPNPRFKRGQLQADWKIFPRIESSLEVIEEIIFASTLHTHLDTRIAQIENIPAHRITSAFLFALLLFPGVKFLSRMADTTANNDS